MQGESDILSRKSGKLAFTQSFQSLILLFHSVFPSCDLKCSSCIAYGGDAVEIRGFIPTISTVSPRRQMGKIPAMIPRSGNILQSGSAFS